MRYELIKNSHTGVITDPTPVLLDIAGTFKITFDLPGEGAYFALFRDEGGIEYKAVIRGGEATVPRGIIGKEQLVGLTVCLTDGDKILWAWECHPLKIGSLLQLRKTQWQLTSGFSDAELLARLAEIERVHAETETRFEELKREYEGRTSETERILSSLEKRLSEAETTNKTLAEAYNKATIVVNDLSKRVYNLEKNYDPTLIK